MSPVRTTTSTSIRLRAVGTVLALAGLTACDDESKTGSAGAAASSTATSAASSAPPEQDTATGTPDVEGPRPEFCDPLHDLYFEVGRSLDEGADISTAIDQMQGYARRLVEIGVPDDAPADAAAGLGVALEAILELPDGATLDDLAASSAAYTDQELALTDAFSVYLVDACPEVYDAIIDRRPDRSLRTGRT